MADGCAALRWVPRCIVESAPAPASPAEEEELAAGRAAAALAYVVTVYIFAADDEGRAAFREDGFVLAEKWV